ncbi:MAG: RyR domain-containing protein, partial [Myxococcota bacterium]
DHVQADEVTAAILQRIRHAEGRRVRAAIVLCFEEDRLSFESALALQHALFNEAAESGLPEGPVPLFVYLPVELGLAKVIAPESGETPEPGTPGAVFPLRPFGARDVVASYERITMPDLRIHAKAARKVYERLERGHRAKLHQDFAASNFDAAQHAKIKLAALGIRLTEPGETPPPEAPRVLADLLTPKVDGRVRDARRRLLDDAAFDRLDGSVQQRLALADATNGIDAAKLERAIDAAVDAFEAQLRAEGRDPELVARMEHNRWMGERLTAGWRYGERSNLLRKRPSMVPFELLGTHDQRHDRIDLVRFLVQEWTWQRTPYFGADPAEAGSTQTTGTPRRSA